MLNIKKAISVLAISSSLVSFSIADDVEDEKNNGKIFTKSLENQEQVMLKTLQNVIVHSSKQITLIKTPNQDKTKLEAWTAVLKASSESYAKIIAARAEASKTPKS